MGFASSATNIFYGDAIPASEIYLTEEIPSSGQIAAERIGQLPLAALTEPEWALDATAYPQRDGSVLVYASVPGAGKLRVQAVAELPANAARSAKRKKGTKIQRRAKASRKGALEIELSSRTVAQGASTARAPANLHLRLRIRAPYRSAVDSTGLYTVLRVTFSAPHHRTLNASIPVTFHRAPTRRHTHGAGR